MNERKQRIDEFLKYLSDIAKQNPSYRFSLNSVYSELTKLGLPISEKKKKINDNFDTWINYFKDNRKFKVFVSPKRPYFCQFVSNDRAIWETKDQLKIYISLDSNHISRGAVEIFNFLSNQNISHESKIGKEVRFDDIVVRLVNPNDVEKLVQFVSDNKYIQEGLMTANPFAFNLNGISMAIDGNLSYNAVISNMIQMYINEKNKNKILDTVSADDFYKFIENYYKKAFSSAEGLNMLESQFEIESIFDADVLVNYKNVFELILKSSKENFSFDDYVNHYLKCSNQEILEREISQIEDIQAGRKHAAFDLIGLEEEMAVKEEIDNSSLNMIEKNQHNALEKETISTIREILQIMTDKYGARDSIENLKEYIESGNPKLLTREFNLRERVANSSFRLNIKKVLQQRGMELSDYLDAVVKIDFNSKEEYIENAIVETCNKYDMIWKEGLSNCSGKEVAIDAVMQLIMHGFYGRFTRDNFARQNLQANVSAADAVKIIKSEIGLDEHVKLSKDQVKHFIRHYVDKVLENRSYKQL